MALITQEYGALTDMATQKLIAPVFLTNVASVALDIGDLFIINNTLYKATAAIAVDDPISVGTGSGDNAIEASTVSQELRGGLKSTTTWSVAYNKAQSYIIVNFTFFHSSQTREVNILVFKDNLESTNHYVVGTGGAFSSGGSTYDILAQVAVSTSGMFSYYLFVNSTNVADTATIKYFYD